MKKWIEYWIYGPEPRDLDLMPGGKIDWEIHKARCRVRFMERLCAAIFGFIIGVALVRLGVL